MPAHQNPSAYLWPNLVLKYLWLSLLVGYFARMCWDENPAPRKYKGCGHTVKEPAQPRVVWCPEASRSGSQCDVVKKSSKASSTTKRKCPECREKEDKKKDDEGTGAGGTGSSTIASGISIATPA
ncbi:predicted protein [Coccidioides posadasii str. Silveira]|uniref:Predicted protein n=3 Tax=Coccidioides posadasii TaxID=199306 RepID=E9DFE3_COCPS|nr:predicted protein [Coccidioides posadasii str. Silveira]KMM70467.1 hypothetical protein CPAG_06779 [Coccidioides posadasii RMSCC 3488]